MVKSLFEESSEQCFSYSILAWLCVCDIHKKNWDVVTAVHRSKAILF